MDKIKALPMTPLPQGKANPNSEEQTRKKKSTDDGLIGLVNIGNSCYMNATLQALSNCPPFRQYLIECYHPMASSGQSFSTQRASDMLTVLFKKMWASERSPGHLSPRPMSSAMKNRMFKGNLQQDAQEFLRCLLTQIHDEIGTIVPEVDAMCGCGQESCDSTGCHRDSKVSASSHESDCSNGSSDSNTKLVGSARNSPLSKKRSSQSLSSSSSRQKLHGSTHSLAQNSPRFSLKGSYSKIRGSSSARSSTESIHKLGLQHGGSQSSLVSHSSEAHSQQTEEKPALKWSEGDVFIVDLITRGVTVHRNYCLPAPPPVGSSDGGTIAESGEAKPTDQVTKPVHLESDRSPLHLHQGQSKESVPSESVHNESEKSGSDKVANKREELRRTSEHSPTHSQNPKSVSTNRQGSPTQSHQSLGLKASQPPLQQTPPVALREKKKKGEPQVRSIVSEVFEGMLESRVKCLACKKVSVRREPFQDLSLPIPGRKEMAKSSQKMEGSGESKQDPSTLSRGFCTVWNFVTSLTRDLFVGPPTDIRDCLNAFFDTSELKGDNRYFCSNCKRALLFEKGVFGCRKCRNFQNSLKEMSIVKLPEVLCIHLKRFRFDSYFSTKISRHIAFPLTDLDMSAYIKEAPGTRHYALNAIVTHYGGAGGGHYVAFAKNTVRNSWFEFNDTRVRPVSTDTVLGAEGYVLFYRRVAPSNSQAAQSIDMISLLPQRGTLVPSPAVCYISRHWLHLMKTCAHPGPIFQYEFACKHGGVIPTRVEDAPSLSLAIRREVWDNLQQRYGGGPLVQRLDVCQKCQAYLQLLGDKRKQEKEDIHELQTKGHNQVDRKAEPYLLSLEWLQMWQKFIHCSTLEVGPPGPVDNTVLLQTVEGKGLSLVEGASFRKLSSATWHYFLRCYGGGPTIVTSLGLAQRSE